MEQLEEKLLMGTKTHGFGLNVSHTSDELKVTLPAGLDFTPAVSTSVTVAVTVLLAPSFIVEGLNMIVVVVARVFT